MFFICPGLRNCGFLMLMTRPVLGQRHHQVGLARQESRQLQHVDDLRHRLALPGLVHVGDQGHAETRLHGLEDLQPFFQAGTAVAVDGAAVGLVEAGLEDVGDAELLGDGDVVLAGAQRQVERLQHVDAAAEGRCRARRAGLRCRPAGRWG
jgi:hypothetical protein